MYALDRENDIFQVISFSQATHIWPTNYYSEEEGIIHFADSIDADLVAMSTHGRTGFAHVLVVSIAEDVANHSKGRYLLMGISKNQALIIQSLLIKG